MWNKLISKQMNLLSIANDMTVVGNELVKRFVIALSVVLARSQLKWWG
jgi:hypothetical protein